jgi:hypothetical protein
MLRWRRELDRIPNTGLSRQAHLGLAVAMFRGLLQLELRMLGLRSLRKEISGKDLSVEFV